MTEIRTAAITLGGAPTDLAGPELKIGDAAPDFILQNNALEDVTLDTFAGMSGGTVALKNEKSDAKRCRD